jgi:hypothetical protein
MWENDLVMEDFYVGYLCNNPRYPFSPMYDVVKGQMFIVQSREIYYVICLGMERGIFYQDLDATMECYK